MGPWVFTEVSVAGTPPLDFCVDPSADDALSRWLIQHDWVDEPVQRLLVDLVRPGMRVLDLGAQLGTFSLPAAALGADVLAVDASAEHVERLRVAAQRNGLEKLQVVHAAIDAREAHRLQAEAPDTTVDELLESRGWRAVGLVRMHLDGGEGAALDGMEELLARARRPAMVIECDGAALARLGSSVVQLGERLVEHRYRLLTIDQLTPGRLLKAPPDTLQPERACSILASVSRPRALQGRWRIDPPFGRVELITRLLDAAAGDAWESRRYAGQLMVDGPAWLRAAPELPDAIRALEHDLDPRVQAAVAPEHELSWAVESMLAPDPPARGLPVDSRLAAEGVALRRPSTGLDPVQASLEPSSEELLLGNAWLHLRSGQLVGVVAEERPLAMHFLRLLAGRERPAAGRIEVSGRPVLVSPLCVGMELELSVEENMFALGQFLGLAASTIGRGRDRIAEITGLAGELDTELEHLPAARQAQLALAVTLELCAPELLLLDEIPALGDGRFVERLHNRIAELRAAGAAVVQAVGAVEDLLGPADRVLWIAASRVQASGHAASVLEAYRRHRLGLASRPLERRPSLAMRVPR